MGNPTSLGSLRNLSGNLHATPTCQGQAWGLLALTFLLCDGTEVSVAGQGGFRLLVNIAAHGRSAPCQALHGPGLHTAPTAGCALLRSTCMAVTQGCSILRALPSSKRPPPPTLLKVVSLYDGGWLIRFWINPRYDQREEVPRSLECS